MKCTGWLGRNHLQRSSLIRGLVIVVVGRERRDDVGGLVGDAEDD